MSQIQKLVDSVVVTPVAVSDPVPTNMPYVTHEGKLKLGSVEIDVVVLSTGRRVLTGKFVEYFTKQFSQKPDGFCIKP